MSDVRCAMSDVRCAMCDVHTPAPTPKVPLRGRNATVVRPQSAALAQVRKNSFAATATKPLMLNHINSATSLSLSVNVAAPFKDDATFYATERACCRIYVHMGVHLHIVLLLLSLLVSPHHILDDRYCDSFPSHHRKVDVLYILHQHLNHVANKCLGNVLYRR